MADLVERLRYPMDATADMIEAADEIERLRERCNPSKVVKIGDVGHYVSEAVYAEIERLIRVVREETWNKVFVLEPKIERLQARVAHLNLDIENLRAAVREACLIFNDHVLTQDIDSATEGAANAYLAAHSIPEKQP